MHGVGPGSLLGGRYVVSQRIDRHPRYERWAAADQTLDRDVVLLCFDSEGPVGSATLDAARRAAGVEDHRLVRILDVGRDPQLGDGVAFVVEEPLTGARPVTAALSDGGLPAEEARGVIGEVAAALERARVRGLHHGVLTPRSVFLLPDGAVKVRGLATEAALLEADIAAPEQATRSDTVSIVALGYALLTGRWPLPGRESGLEAAPRVVGGVASPSDIAAGVPRDLDVLARTTLNEDGGPQTPGELLDRIGPWSATAVATIGLGLGGHAAARTEPLERASGAGAPAARARSGTAASPGARAGAPGRGPRPRTGGGASGSPRSVLGMRLGPSARPSAATEAAALPPSQGAADETGQPDAQADAHAELQAGAWAESRADAQADDAQADDAQADTRSGAGDEHAAAPGWSEGWDEGDDDGTNPPASRRPSPLAGAVAAGSAVARGLGGAVDAAGGLASAVGGKVGGTMTGMARGAADRAAERAAAKAERRRTERYEDPAVVGEEVRLSDTLEPTDEQLEPVVPRFLATAQQPLDRDQSRVVLLIVVAFVLVAAVLGLWGLPKLSGITLSGSVPVVTATVTATPTQPAPAAAPTPSPASTPQATALQPLPIASASQISQDAGVQPSPNTAAAYDGNPATMWRSQKWFATPQYGGYPNRQLGLLLDLGQPRDVHQVSLTTRGAADITVFVATQPTTTGATPIGSASQLDGDGTVAVPNGGAVQGQYVIVWFTTLSPDGQGRFRAQLAEVSVR